MPHSKFKNLKRSVLILLLSAGTAGASPYGVVTFNTYLLRDRLVGDLKPDLAARAKLIPHRLAEDPRVRLALVQEVWTPGLRRQLADDMSQLGFPYRATMNSIQTVNIANACGSGLALAGIGALTRVARSEAPFTRRNGLRTAGWLALGGTSEFGAFLGFNIDDHWRNMGNGLEIFSKDPIRKVSQVGFGWAVAEESEYFVNKGAIMAEIELRPGVLIKAYTTHLPSVHMETGNTEEKTRHRAARLAAARIFADFIRATSSSTDNRIVGGDFNVDPFEYRQGGFTKNWSPEYALFTRDLKLVDDFHRKHGFEPRALTDDHRNPYVAGSTSPEKYIDWLLRSGPSFGADALYADIVFKEPVTAQEVAAYGLPTHPSAASDHWGSKVILEVNDIP